jgi:hypothetical protein
MPIPSGPMAGGGSLGGGGAVRYRVRVRFWSRYKMGGATVPWWGLVPLYDRVTDWTKVGGRQSVGIPSDVDCR